MIRLSAADAKRLATQPAQVRKPRRPPSATPDRIDLLAACAGRGWYLLSYNGGRWQYTHVDGRIEEAADYLELLYR